MLYERWRETAARHAGRPALRETGSGRWWTFAELAGAAADHPAPGSPIAHPAGHSADFILGILAAWREHRVVCPLEPGQPAPMVPGPPAGCRHLKLTSGTSGTPRLIAFTEEQMAADCDHIVSTMGLRPDWPNLGVISLAHSYGFSNLVLPLLLHGIPLILVPSPLPATLAAAAAGIPALTLPGVPALWRAWHEAGVIPPGVRLAISAGAPLPIELENSIHTATGLKVHNFIGASECGGIAFDRSPTPRTDPSLAGTALDGVHLSRNADGCLVVESPAVGTTYWPEPDPRLGAGVYQSQDLADLDEAGRVFLRGRATDVINVAGRKVPPESIEAVLRMHPDVREAVVFGMAAAADDPRGETIVAVIHAPARDADVLREHVRARLPAWQVPREWWFTDTLCASHRGKISRPEWRRRYQSRSA